jgi:hypothetical protein
VKKIILVVTTLALACGLMLGTMGTATASTSQGGQGRGVFGTVESVDISDDGTGTITVSNVKPSGVTENATTLVVETTEDTVYHIPTVTIVPKWQTWEQLTAESQSLVEDANRVAILLTDPAGDHTAQKVMIVPAEGLCRYRHQLGIVTKVEGDTATIAKRNGEEVTVVLDEGVEVEVGQVVVLVTEKNTGEVQLRALRAYRWELMVQRFEGYLNGSLNQASFDNVTAKLQRAHEKHIRTLEALQTRLEQHNRPQAAEKVGNAKGYAEARYAEAMELRQQIWDRVQEVGWDEWLAQWGKASGTIASVNTQTRTMTLNTDNGTLTLQVTGGAVITKHGYLYGLRGLNAGDSVNKVIYNKDTGRAWYVEVQ